MNQFGVSHKPSLTPILFFCDGQLKMISFSVSCEQTPFIFRHVESQTVSVYHFTWWAGSVSATWIRFQFRFLRHVAFETGSFSAAWILNQFRSVPVTPRGNGKLREFIQSSSLVALLTILYLPYYKFTCVYIIHWCTVPKVLNKKMYKKPLSVVFFKEIWRNSS